jgi:hypothetical protein
VRAIAHAMPVSIDVAFLAQASKAPSHFRVMTPRNMFFHMLKWALLIRAMDEGSGLGREGGEEANKTSADQACFGPRVRNG